MKVLSTRTVLGDLTEMWSLLLCSSFHMFCTLLAINAARRMFFQLSGIFANVQLDMLKVFGLVNYLNTF